FAYANAWGNNFGLFMPFFIGTWLRRGTGWRRPVGAVLLVLAIVPIAYSLNRGLWIGLFFALVFISARMAMIGHVRVLQATLAAERRPAAISARRRRSALKASCGG